MKPQRRNGNIFKEGQLYKTVQCNVFPVQILTVQFVVVSHYQTANTSSICALYFWLMLLPNRDLYSQTSGNSTPSANWLWCFQTARPGTHSPAHQAFGLTAANANLLHRCHLDGSFNTKSINWWFFCLFVCFIQPTSNIVSWTHCLNFWVLGYLGACSIIQPNTCSIFKPRRPPASEPRLSSLPSLPLAANQRQRPRPHLSHVSQELLFRAK